MANKFGRKNPDKSVMHCWGQRSCRGQLGGKLLRNALWQPNLIGRTPEQSVMHWCGQRSCRGQLGSIRGKLLRKALWQPNLIGRTPDQSVVQ